MNVEPFLILFVTAAQLTLPMYTLTLQRDSIQVGGNAGMLSIGEMPSGAPSGKVQLYFSNLHFDIENFEQLCQLYGQLSLQEYIFDFDF